MKRLAMLLCLVLWPSLVLGHDVWVGDDYTILFGHADAEPESYPADRLVSADVLADDGEAIAFKTERVDGMTRLVPESAPAMVLIGFDNGYYTQSAGDYERGRAMVLPDAEESRRFLKFGKTIFDWAPAAAEPRDMVLELVPLRDPAKLEANAALPVRVLFRGESLTGATVLRDVPGQQAEFDTDADGRAEVAYDPNRAQRYTVRHKVPGLAADVVSVQLATTLHIHPSVAE